MTAAVDIDQLTPEYVSCMIEKRVLEMGIHGSYIAETSAFFEERDIEASDGLKYLSGVMISKIKAEAIKSRHVRSEKVPTSILTFAKK